MPEGLLTRQERTEPPPVGIATAAEEPRREWARRHIESVRALKMHVAAYLVGMVLLTPVWMLVEWSDNGALKHMTFNDEGRAGDWEPWILYVALIWGLVVAIKALTVYFDRPTSEAEIVHELRRWEPRA